MGSAAVLWSLTIGICSLSVAALSVFVSWRTASRCTAVLKSLRARNSTQISDVRIAAVESDQAELFSILEKLTTTVKRLSSRAGMQDVRARRSQSAAGDAPPIGAPKSELRKFYNVGPVGVPMPLQTDIED